MSQESVRVGGGPIVSKMMGLAMVGVGAALLFGGNINQADTNAVRATSGSGQEMAVVPIDLPNPAFAGTPSAVPEGVRLDRSRLGKKRASFMAPADAELLSADLDVTSSDDYPIIGSLDLITDGDKEPLDGRYVELAPDKQHVTIDLGDSHEIYGIVFWHNHMDPRVYRDVVVMISDNEEFENATIVFNNDSDNSSGFGVGENYEYFESDEGELAAHTEMKEGRLVMTKSLGTARYVRLWSNGSTIDDQNHYAEVEIWGKP